jgi:hypothetical protein
MLNRPLCIQQEKIDAGKAKIKENGFSPAGCETIL